MSLKNVPLKLLREWPDNPRQAHDQAKHAELVESIKAGGLLQPLLCRPLPLVGPASGWIGNPQEVICGNRRRRALIEIHGADADIEIPVLSRDLTDDEALGAALKENGDRNGLSPLEEGAAFARMHRSGKGKSIVDIAAEIGKPAPYVMGRLRLLRLHSRGCELLRAGLLPLGAAFVLSQLNEDTQLDALGKVFSLPDSADDPIDLAKAIPEWKSAITIKDIHRAIDLDDRALSKATFPILDADLVPGVGPCTGCPKRTGAQGSLFDGGGTDACLDNECWQAKKVAAGRRIAQEAEAAGTLLPSAVVEGLFNKSHFGGFSLKWDAKFVDVLDRPAVPHHGGKLAKQSYAELAAAAGEAGQVVVAVDPSGVVHRLVPRALATKLTPKAPKAKAGTKTQAPSGIDAAWAKEKEEQRRGRLDFADELDATFAASKVTQANAYGGVLLLAATLAREAGVLDESVAALKPIAEPYKLTLGKKPTLDELLVGRAAGQGFLILARALLHDGSLPTDDLLDVLDAAGLADIKALKVAAAAKAKARAKAKVAATATSKGAEALERADEKRKPIKKVAAKTAKKAPAKKVPAKKKAA